MKKQIIACGVGITILALAHSTSFAGETKLWSQQPYMARGYGYSSEIRLGSIVADEWTYHAGTPVSGIGWWGEYWKTPTSPSYYSDSLPVSQPGGIDHFVIKIWSAAQPENGSEFGFSSPGTVLKTFEAKSFTEAYYGATQKGRSVYSYFMPITDQSWFQEAKSGTYFISIQASGAETTKQWGWHESSDHTDTAAVQKFNGSGWYTLENNVYTNDMAFEIFTAPEPGSMIILGSGLVGLAGLMIRRRI